MTRAVLELLEGLRVFWRVEAGVARSQSPRVGGQRNAKSEPTASQNERRIAQLQDSLRKKNRRIEQQSRRIERLEGYLSKKDSSLARLHRQLAEKAREVDESGTANPRRSVSREHVPIFFVVGRQRSGTNWLMRTLNSHPEILCTGEGRFFGKHSRYEYLKDMQTSEHIKFKIQPSSLYNALAEDEYLRLWLERSVWTRDDDLEEQLGRLTRQAVRYFMTERLFKTNKRMVGDKTPLASTEIVRDIGFVCPEAKVIHIIRDGRDVAVSGMHHVWNRATDVGGIYDLTPEELDKRDRYRKDPRGFLASNESIFSESRLRVAAEDWAARVRAACDDGPALLGNRYAEVRYENLLVSPHEEFGRLFSFLGAASDEETVSSCVMKTSFELRSGGRRQGEEDSCSGARKGIAGDWKEVFTEKDKEVFKGVTGDTLVELGYEKGPDW